MGQNYTDSVSHYLCVLFSGNFAGFDCGECKFGWTGPNCNLRKAPVIRRNIMSLSVDERQVFLEALQRSKRTVHPQYVIATEHWLGLIDRETNQTRFSNISVYDLFVWQHYYSVRDTLLGEKGQRSTLRVKAWSKTVL